MEVRERLLHIIFTAHQVAFPKMANSVNPEELKKIGEEVEIIYRRVQGNKPDGYVMPPSDQLIMLEAALRRANQILDEAGVANG